METKKTSNKFSPEVRVRAVRMVHEHQADYPSQWMAIQSVATKIGCSGETLRNWIRQAGHNEEVLSNVAHEKSNHLSHYN